jgi:hypothetical protein
MNAPECGPTSPAAAASLATGADHLHDLTPAPSHPLSPPPSTDTIFPLDPRKQLSWPSKAQQLQGAGQLQSELLRSYHVVGLPATALAIVRSQSMLQLEDKLTHLTMALQRDKEQSCIRQLLRDVLWGSMQRWHQLLHPQESPKQQMNHFRRLLCDPSQLGSWTSEELDQLHARWRRIKVLLRSEADGVFWACFATTAPSVQVLNRDKLIALARHERSWTHMDEKARHDFWRTMMSSSSSAKEIDRLCSQITITTAGQYKRAS